jgi:hypothetical protein
MDLYETEAGMIVLAKARSNLTGQQIEVSQGEPVGRHWWLGGHDLQMRAICMPAIIQWRREKRNRRTSTVSSRNLATPSKDSNQAATSGDVRELSALSGF